eukprot:Lankesteria_metandrocarpae@DN4082_c1_g1_i1.p1
MMLPVLVGLTLLVLAAAVDECVLNIGPYLYDAKYVSGGVELELLPLSIEVEENVCELENRVIIGRQVVFQCFKTDTGFVLKSVKQTIVVPASRIDLTSRVHRQCQWHKTTTADMHAYLKEYPPLFAENVPILLLGGDPMCALLFGGHTLKKVSGYFIILEEQSASHDELHVKFEKTIPDPHCKLLPQRLRQMMYRWDEKSIAAYCNGETKTNGTRTANQIKSRRSFRTRGKLQP